MHERTLEREDPDRDDLLRVLAHLDQQIERARILASSQLLTRDQRNFAAEQLKLRRYALVRCEKLLDEPNEKRDP
jgi:hypothetical protein